jgi:hypothetical protein
MGASRFSGWLPGIGRAGESEGAVANAMIECGWDRVVRSGEEVLKVIADLPVF